MLDRIDDDGAQEQNLSIASQLKSQVCALGVGFDPTIQIATQKIYRPHLDMRAAQERLDVEYGADARQRLDLYLPEHTASAVVVFVHGGGFIGGSKNEDGTFYANVGRFLARNGFAAVLPSYRLAPAFAWPCAALDVRDAVSWARHHVAGAGGAQLPLIVIGQSAGASHVASWLFDHPTRAAPLGPVAGVMLMSGYYKAVAPLASNLAAYFGDDPAQYARRSPLTHVAKTDIPIWLSVAQYDPGIIAARSFEMAQALCVCNGRSPEFAYLRGHNHVSTVMSLGSPHDDCGKEMLAFLRSLENPHTPNE